MVSLVIMVAGLSSRFGGTPKALAKIGSKTLMERTFDHALKQKFNNIILIVSEKTKQPFFEKFGDSYNGQLCNKIPIIYCVQEHDKNRSKPWGTADALCSIVNHVDDKFIVCNGDDLYGADTFEVGYNKLKSDNNYTICFRLGNTLYGNGKVNRGVCEIKDDHVVKINEYFGITAESKDVNMESISSVNFFCLHKDVLHKMIIANKEFKLKHRDDQTKEHILPVYLGSNVKLKYHVMDGKFYGITTQDDVEMLATVYG